MQKFDFSYICCFHRCLQYVSTKKLHLHVVIILSHNSGTDFLNYMYMYNPIAALIKLYLCHYARAWALFSLNFGHTVTVQLDYKCI